MQINNWNKEKLTISLSIVAIVLVILVGNYLNTHNPKQVKEIFSTDDIKAGRMTLHGEYLCLYPKNIPQNSTSTDNCVSGIKTDNNKYYILDLLKKNNSMPDFSIGDRLLATGTVTPIKMLNTDSWKNYNVTGIFSVSDTVEKINPEPISYKCNSEVKTCSDGSKVGRTGSDCEFVICHTPKK